MGFWRKSQAACAALGLIGALALSACVAPAPRGGLGAPVASGAATAPAPQVSGPAQVAVLLPRAAGANAQEVTDMQAAARMASAESGGAIALSFIDTGPGGAAAAAAARQAAASGAAVIAGPVFMTSAQAVKPALGASGLRALALTPAASVAGSGVYVMGFTPDDEVDAILAHAASQGLRRIALLRPVNDAYGDAVERAARAAAPRHGASIVSSSAYVRSNAAIAQGVQAAAADIAAAGADAVLLADRGAGLVALAAFLNYYDTPSSRVKYLGLSGWETSSTLREPALQGGWFATPDSGLREAFAARFQTANGRRPSRNVVLAYDAVKAVAEMAPQARGRGFDDALIRSRSFTGAGGAFRFGPDGVVRRSVAIMQVDGGGFTTIRPASAAPQAGS